MTNNIIPFTRKRKQKEEIVFKGTIIRDENDPDIFMIDWTREPPTIDDYSAATFLYLMLASLADIDEDIARDFGFVTYESD